MNQVLQKYNSDNPMEYELDELNQIMSTGISVKAMAKVLGMTNEELNVITDKIEKEIESVRINIIKQLLQISINSPSINFNVRIRPFQ